jgi:sarcosine oxidase subunit alpha
MSGGEHRLPAPAGMLIDRKQPVDFTFEGRGYRGFAGDTIASALAAHGVRVLSRSFKYHRPRGILTMAGQDANTLVQIGPEPNVLADRRPISDGLTVLPQNVSGSLERDRAAIMGRFGRFMPAGFYYRAFYRPRGIWQRFWEPIVRRSAGLGRVDTGAPHGYFDKAYGFYDVAVIGGGPAGLSAALAAAQSGAEVLLVEENPILGGAMNFTRFDVAGEQAAARRAELVAAVEAAPNITVMTDAVCNGWFTDNWLPVIHGNRMYKIRAHEVVLAAGTLEQPAVFRNNDLPGVMMGSAAQRLIRLYGVCPGRCAVVLTGNSHGYMVALDLLDAGVEIAAVIDQRQAPQPDPAIDEVINRGVRVLSGHTLSEAIPGPGKRSVIGAEIDSIVGPGEVAGQSERVACDTIAMCVGYTPTYQLALQAGGRLGYDDTAAMFSIDELPAHLHLAGSVNGRHDLDTVLADGRRAGWRAAQGAGHTSGAEPDVPAEHGESPNFPWPIYPHPKGKEFIDFDEDLQVRDILGSAAEGYAELELVKRFSTVGMGPSQGRHSALNTARLVAKASGRTVAETGVTTARPPFTGEKLGVLGGRAFNPERHTAMHHRHLEAGAQMMPAGLWWRPAFYGAPVQREACLREEALAVRTGLGLIDVSTLGGLEVRGPDAAEFLERMYTFAYKKQPVGRSRYVLMTNEAGTIIDDGVACRLGLEHFYVTATTGGVDRIYLSMLWWNARWRLKVDVANVTAAYAGVNIAGPKSREALAAVTEGVDLGAEVFPYMGVREGRCAGIPARFMRVGFVGELGYEVHVSASQGEALWDAVMDAGAAHGIRPFGVEAQRVLRLEKGHIIIGQDTDAMSHPHEVDMAWAIAKKKPFFVGGRSIELRLRQPTARKLAGFSIDGRVSEMPGESNLVLHGETITGFVTSVVRSPILDKVIGLAYVHPDDAEVGKRIELKLDSGRRLGAEVVPLPFYDPENQRQEM